MAGVRQFDEDTLLEDALALFWSQGVAATSMVDLANATGVQRGSLYNAYGDREAIFLRAYDRYAARFLDSARACLAGDDASRMLRRLFNAVTASMLAGSPARGCLTTRTAGDGSLASQPIRARIRQMLNDLTAIVTEALSRPGGDGAGLWRPERPAAQRRKPDQRHRARCQAAMTAPVTPPASGRMTADARARS